MLPWPLAFAACWGGIWIGDLALYALARRYGRPILKKKFMQKLVTPEHLARSEEWFAESGVWALVISRFVPGMRLTTFVMAGLLRLSAWVFAPVTAVLSLLWVGLIFGLVHFLGRRAEGWFHEFHHYAPWLLLPVVFIGLALLLWKHPRFKRWRQWEFWPGWLFYSPVAVYYTWLAVRHRGLTLPTLANPGIYTGGIIGESKFETLSILEHQAPGFTATTRLLLPGPLAQRLTLLKAVCLQADLEPPFVLKPDQGQRGAGFRVVRHWDEAEECLMRLPVPLVVQRYIPGPHEAGLFYYRLPDEECGRLFAITDKIFPRLVGDGTSTVEQLIHADARAVLIADKYLTRHADKREFVLPAGETFRLVEAGNHAQGCIFQDGRDLWSEQLEARIDDISRRVPGFFIGRYDVRYSSVEALKRGEGFSILELNGAASEATNLYDARYTLAEAYGILFRQWEIVFRIGAMNRELGHHALSARDLFSEWLKQREIMARYPAAD
jgi:membrane protein DedA with SNARE-associated domain